MVSTSQNKMLHLVVVFLIAMCSQTTAETNSELEGADAKKKMRRDDDSYGKGHSRRLPKHFILESLSVLRSQAASTNIFLQQIRNSFDGIERRLDKMDERLDRMNEKMEDRLGKMNDRFDLLEGTMKKSLEKTDVVREHVALNEDMISKVQAGIVANREVTATIKARQNVMLSEVRLISLYKMTDQSSTLTHGHGGHSSDFVVDGQFIFSGWSPSSAERNIAHTKNGANEKISIDLGALFRIHRVKIWHSRHCPFDNQSCKNRMFGLRILADERLLGVTSSVEWIHDFKVLENDPIYAKSITLQRKRDYIHILEVQVWGTGPFAEDDKFA